MQISVTCVDCAKSFSLDDSRLPELLKDESVVVKEVGSPSWSYSTYFGVCDDCQAIFKAATRKPKRRMTVEEESKAIQQRLNLIREQRPELTLEQAARAAVEDINDPLLEPNLSFRAFLLDRDEH